MRNEFTSWISIPTRFRDLDPMKHVNSTIYFMFLENARIDYFTNLSIDRWRNPGKFGIPLVSQTCNYRQQLFHPSTVDVGVRCTELREKTVHLSYEIYLQDTETLMADGVSVSAWVDLTVSKAVAMPKDLRLAIESLEGKMLSL